MAEYTNLKKYIKSFSSDQYNPNTEGGFWKTDTLDGVSVWYIEVPRIEHTVFEPNCKVYKLNTDFTYEEFEPFKLKVDSADTVFLYVSVDISSFNNGRLNGKLLIF